MKRTHRFEDRCKTRIDEMEEWEEIKMRIPNKKVKYKPKREREREK